MFVVGVSFSSEGFGFFFIPCVAAFTVLVRLFMASGTGGW